MTENMTRAVIITHHDLCPNGVRLLLPIGYFVVDHYECVWVIFSTCICVFFSITHWSIIKFIVRVNITKLSLSPSSSFNWKAEVALFLVNPATHPPPPTRESLFGSPRASNLGHIRYLNPIPSSAEGLD